MMALALRAFYAVSLILMTAVLVQPGTVLAQGKTQKISKNLVKRAEEMVKQVEKTKKQVNKTAGKYDSIFGKRDVKGRQKAYKDLNKEIKKTENMVKDVRKRGENMQKEADKFFSEWSKGLTKIKDTELRGLSHTNMTETRDRYGEVIESGLKASSLYEAYLTDLKNQCAYLELDMSDSGMAKLKPSQDEAKSKSKALFKSVDELTKTTKSYISSMK